jgi:hypothetical protein
MQWYYLFLITLIYESRFAECKTHIIVFSFWIWTYGVGVGHHTATFHAHFASRFVNSLYPTYLCRARSCAAV